MPEGRVRREVCEGAEIPGRVRVEGLRVVPDREARVRIGPRRVEEKRTVGDSDHRVVGSPQPRVVLAFSLLVRDYEDFQRRRGRVGEHAGPDERVVRRGTANSGREDVAHVEPGDGDREDVGVSVGVDGSDVLGRVALEGLPPLGPSVPTEAKSVDIVPRPPELCSGEDVGDLKDRVAALDRVAASEGRESSRIKDDTANEGVLGEDGGNDGLGVPVDDDEGLDFSEVPAPGVLDEEGVGAVVVGRSVNRETPGGGGHEGRVAEKDEGVGLDGGERARRGGPDDELLGPLPVVGLSEDGGAVHIGVGLDRAGGDDVVAEGRHRDDVRVCAHRLDVVPVYTRGSLTRRDSVSRRESRRSKYIAVGVEAQVVSLR
jgi:hypothetical protein